MAIRFSFSLMAFWIIKRQSRGSFGIIPTFVTVHLLHQQAALLFLSFPSPSLSLSHSITILKTNSSFILINIDTYTDIHTHIKRCGGACHVVFVFPPGDPPPAAFSHNDSSLLNRYSLMNPCMFYCVFELVESQVFYVELKWIYEISVFTSCNYIFDF